MLVALLGASCGVQPRRTQRPSALQQDDPEPALHSTRQDQALGYYDTLTVALPPNGIAALCDLVVLAPSPNGVVRNAQNPRTIFVSMRERDLARRRTAADALVYFFKELFPLLTDSFVLITGSEDYTLPRQSDTRMEQWDPEIASMFRTIYDSPLLEKWAVENLAGPLGPKMVPLPLGFVGNQCGEDKSFHQDRPVCPEMWSVIKASRQTRIVDKPLEMTCSGRVHDAGWGMQVHARQAVADLCAEGGAWHGLLGDTSSLNGTLEMPHEQYVGFLGKKAFTICTHGGGVDPAPKAFEALAAGSIPIVRHSDLDAAYRQLPVAFVDNWEPEAITPEKLQRWRYILKDSFDTPEGRHQLERQLTLDYWWQYVLEGTSVGSSPRPLRGNATERL